MEKSIRILSLISVIGTAVIMHGQSRSAMTEGKRMSNPSTQVAAQVSDNCESVLCENVLQKVMSWHFCNMQNHAIELAKEKNNERTVEDVIKVNCYYLLALKRPDQQQHEIRDVWQVQDWVPNDANWKAVTSAPCMAKEILTISPRVEAKIQKLWAVDSEESSKDFHDLNLRLAKEPGFMQLSATDRNMRIHAEYEKIRAAKPQRTPAQNYADASVRSRRVIDSSLTWLTPAQKAEVLVLLKNYEAELSRVMSGKRPSFLAP